MTLDKFTPVSHVIFDMDGLLLDTESRYEKAINSLTMKYGKQYPFELKMKVMGRTGQEVAEIITSELDLPITAGQYIELINEEYVKVFENVQFMPGAEELVKHFHKNSIPIAIATSSKRATFELKTKNLKNVFNLFEHILIASDDPEITRGKPDPQTFLVCASRFADKPKDMSTVLVFEDSPSGVKSAMSAGMQCVWVPDPRIDRNLAKSTLVLDSLFHFRTELFNLPKF